MMKKKNMPKLMVVEVLQMLKGNGQPQSKKC